MATNKELEKKLAELTDVVGMLAKKTVNQGGSSGKARRITKSNAPVGTVFESAEIVDYNGKKYVSFSWQGTQHGSPQPKRRQIPLDVFTAGAENILSILDNA